MNEDALRKLEQIRTKQLVFEREYIEIKNQIHFIEKANKHNITVEQRTLVPDPNPDTDDWGWSGPPMKERIEVRNYSIDKEILLTALRKKAEETKLLLQQFRKEIEEL